MTIDIELLPRPFCGDAAKIAGAYNAYAVNCADCDAYSPSVGSKELALSVWNLRASIPPSTGDGENETSGLVIPPAAGPVSQRDAESAAERDIRESRELWECALAQAAFYVNDHCVDGEHHAETIMSMPLPKIYATPVEQTTFRQETGGDTNPPPVHANAAIAMARESSTSA